MSAQVAIFNKQPFFEWPVGGFTAPMKSLGFSKLHGKGLFE
jgi:hypothetical protein